MLPALLLAVVAADGSSAVGDSSGAFLSAADHGAIMHVQPSSNLFKITEFSDSQFIELGKELSEPTVAIVNSIAVKQLPAVPATFLMVLTGFLCVSFVRDRKIWLRVVLGAFYLGAAGVNAVPQLLANCNEIKVKQSSARKAVCKLEGIIRPMSDAQGIRYIGLLRRMAIPDDDSFAENQLVKSITVHNRHGLNLYALRLASFCLYSYLSAIIKSNYNLPFLVDYLSTANHSWGYLLRVFTSLNSLAHGPPLFA